MDERQRIACGSIGVAALVLGLKYAAFAITGSVALYSDALESVINVVTACVALYAIGVSLQPADESHPYGHSKAEYFSAVLEGVLIVGAAILIGREAYLGLRDPRPLDAPALGLAINAAGGVVNAGWAAFLVSRGTRLRSQALVADGRHLWTDVLTSLGVIAGVAAVAATGLTWVDSAVAGAVAANILWSGWSLMKGSLGGLMDEAAPPETLARIREVISAHADGALEAHDLRTRHAGPLTFVDFHLVVPGHLTVAEAHDICDRIEAALVREMEHTRITIHVEPEDKAKHAGIVVL